MAVEIIIRGRDETGKAFEGVATGLETIGSKAEEQGGRLRGLFSFMGGAAVVGAGAAAAGISAVGAAGLSMNNQMEQSSARIQAFTKDSEQTAEILEMVRDRAARTPFAFNDMSSAAAALLPTSKAAGQSLEDLLGVAEVLAASNPAEGLEGAAFALKEAASGDFTSIIERFNLPRQRLKELKEQGVPDIEAVQIAMKELGLDADLVAGLANTAEGRWSTFKDTLQGLASTLTQPLFDAFSSGLGQVQERLDANMPAIQAFAEGLAGRIGEAIGWLVNEGVPILIAGWEAIQPALATAGERFQALGGVIEDRMAAIQEVIGAVLPIITAFWDENGASIMATAEEVFGTVVEIVETASEIVNTVLRALGGFMREHGREIGAVLTAAWNVISTVIRTALNLISGIVKTALQLLRGDFSGAWQTIQQTAAGFVTGLVKTIEGLGGLLRSAINVAIAALKDAWAALVRAAPELGTGVINGIVQGVSNGVGALIDAVTRAAQQALQAAKDALGIKSPSSVFRDLVGLPIAQGLAQGIAQGAPLVADATRQLSYGAAVVGGDRMIFNVDARGSGMSRDQFESAIRRTNDRTSLQAAARNRMR